MRLPPTPVEVPLPLIIFLTCSLSYQFSLIYLTFHEGLMTLSLSPSPARFLFQIPMSLSIFETWILDR